jgi:hypothetical protein
MAYSRDVADLICARLSEGMSLRETCSRLREERPGQGMPSAPTVRLWVNQDIDGFAERYACAREQQALHWADEILEVADDGTNDWVERVTAKGQKEVLLDREHVMRSNLRVDARKWLLAKLHPVTFGDKVQQQITGPNGGAIQFEDIRAPITSLIAPAGVKENDDAG